ncbi:fumarylacetoacetase [Sphingomonas carotinifaciens]|uniref:fumarylacetoacetase n=1 Tax=Sphingomonas carotinifaciens TaxID=1166323 RepID=A0A6N8LXJ1_9SPHN|nr:fumarylacetoacetase [Sphingomonas carotinifaciens]MWC45653.1 fumarylacetoacetase [Sphingomonas carotinifaciens]
MPTVDETHDPARTCWVPGANGHSDFPIQNLPLGIFSTAGTDPHGGIAIGDHVLDLCALADAGLLNGPGLDAAKAAAAPTLNALLALGCGPRAALRTQVSALLSDAVNQPVVSPLLRRISDCTMHVPTRIGDYTDFYVGIHHATNVGKVFRPDNPLLPNYKYVPIGYHGRASSVRPSGAQVVRPAAQIKSTDMPAPVLAPTRRLDYELELGVWIGSGNTLGTPIPIDRAAEHIAGLSLLNDWSARDVQAWEYQPLGPFLAKNFLTTISPWIVTAEALAPFRTRQSSRPDGDPSPLPYLFDPADQERGALSLTLEVALASARMKADGVPPFRLSRGPASSMYWTIAQMVAHHTVGGCDLNPGDLLGTGTISAATPDGFGSLLELTRNGTLPIELPNGEQRTFLEDGDTLSLSGRLEADGFVAIGFGSCVGTVVPARAV